MSMKFQPCRAIGGQSAEAYVLGMTGEGLIYREILRQRFCWPNCNVDWQGICQHIFRYITVWVEETWQRPHPHPPDEPRTYRISFLRAAHDIACPVGGFLRRTTIRSALQVHFMHHHVQYMLVVLEDGNHPLPRCPKWNIFVPLRALNGKHQATMILKETIEASFDNVIGSIDGILIYILKPNFCYCRDISFGKG